MKICHIITGLGFGGAERLLVNFSNLHAKEHEVYIVYLKELTALVPELDPSITLKYIPLKWNAAYNLKKYLADIKPDVVHTHLGHADLLGLGVSYNMPYKLFCTMHNIWFKWNKVDQFIFLAYRFLLNVWVKRTHVINISRVVQTHVVNTLRVPSKRTHLLYNGIPALKTDPKQASPDLFKEMGIDPAHFNVLFVGRLAPQKSVSTLLLAANLLQNKIQNLKIYLVGEGQLENELKTLCESLGLQHLVEFRKPTPNPEKYFACCDVFVLPSIFEGMGIVLLEAFRAKLPVVVSNVEGPKELVQDKHTGLVFEPGDYNALAEKILKYHNTPELREELGKNGFDFYNEQFRIEDYASNLLKLYTSI
ncbi:glycosyltransferase family 4 protein [Pontibacter ramchanderi]|uniref:Glycosyltransferase involved in cell wall biosynthesis n=1 Tax=Pontibacter ramchanderi TaxID=1179743 RepID=A0A2N3U7K7_9BACT|nr:glycosyltransferase family 4 protein [Pontibacter ramchanderi]PKV62737.1 glycosyltransferase involved in cell wall biosynthesis [Pontibacter ramchanderi]